MKLTKILMATTVLAAAVVAPASAQVLNLQGRAGGPTSDALKSYLGEPSKSALTQSVLDRLTTPDASSVPALGNAKDRVKFWHTVMLDTNAIDHTQTTGLVPEQLGPTRTSRAFAMVQIAVFDALNSFQQPFEPYNDIGNTNNASREAAVSYAAHKVLVTLYPRQKDRLDALLASDVSQIVDSQARINRGRTAGLAAANAILAARANDNSNDPEPVFGGGGRVASGNIGVDGGVINDGSTNLFEWEPDPVGATGEGPIALGAFWGGVTPFIIESGDQFRAPPTPAPGTARYKNAHNEVAKLGGAPDLPGFPGNDEIISTATDATRFIGNYWGYDAVPLLGVPPRLYAQIAEQVGVAQGQMNAVELARYLAMIQVVQADSGIAAWDSKYFYNYWRPVTGVRREDGVPGTIHEADWEPVGVSVINTTNPIRATPPFPAYPSGHATFGASIFAVMEQFFGSETPFTFVSDEYNGLGADPFTPGTPRPLVPVRYGNFDEAAAENGISRVFNGVHWNYDDSEGQRIGRRIARYLKNQATAFQPR